MTDPYYPVWANEPQHDCQFSAVELRQMYHGVEFALNSINKTAKDCGVDFPLSSGALEASRSNMKALMAKLERMIDAAYAKDEQKS